MISSYLPARNTDQFPWLLFSHLISRQFVRQGANNGRRQREHLASPLRGLPPGLSPCQVPPFLIQPSRVSPPPSPARWTCISTTIRISTPLPTLTVPTYSYALPWLFVGFLQVLPTPPVSCELPARKRCPFAAEAPCQLTTVAP